MKVTIDQTEIKQFYVSKYKAYNFLYKVNNEETRLGFPGWNTRLLH